MNDQAWRDRALTFTVWSDPVVERHGSHVESLYVETYWLPVLGPTSLWLLRLAARRTTAVDNTPVDWTVTAGELAAMLGVTKRIVIDGTLARLERYGVAMTAGQGVALRTHLARLPEHYVASKLAAAVSEGAPGQRCPGFPACRARSAGDPEQRESRP